MALLPRPYSVKDMLGLGLGGVAIQGSGTNFQSTGTVQFSNSNGVSFGLSTNGVMTASVAPGGVAIKGSGASVHTAGTVEFVNGGGITFGLSDGSMTASISATATTAGDGGVFLKASGTSTQTDGTVEFSNSNNVSFGLAAGVMTASVAAPDGGVFIKGSGTNVETAGTIEFSNGNGVSFGLSGSTMTASVVPGGVAVQAGAVTATDGTVVFSNANGVSFGLTDGTMTASVSTAAPGGGGTINMFEPFPPVQIAFTALNSGASSYIFPFIVQEAVHADFVRFPFMIWTSVQNGNTIGTATTTHWQAWVHNWSLFTRGTGADSVNLFYSTSGAGGLTQLFSLSGSGTSFSLSLTVSYHTGSDVGTFSSSFSSASANIPINGTLLGYSIFTGNKFIEEPFVHTLSPGAYWMLHNHTRSISAGGLDALFTYPNFQGGSVLVQSYASGFAPITGGSTAQPVFIGQGYITASDTTIALSKISSTQAGYPRAYFQMVGV